MNNPSKSDKDRMNRVASLGCIVCKAFYGVYSPALIHHLTGLKYRSIGKKAKEYIPICQAHHVDGNKEHPSVHGQPELFKQKYGSQEFLLNYTNKFID